MANGRNFLFSVRLSALASLDGQPWARGFFGFGRGFH
jgi:hypothetical protein